MRVITTETKNLKISRPCRSHTYSSKEVLKDLVSHMLVHKSPRDMTSHNVK